MQGIGFSNYTIFYILIIFLVNVCIKNNYCFQLLSSRAMQNGADNEGIWGFLLKDIKNEIARGSKEVFFFLYKICEAYLKLWLHIFSDLCLL